MSCATVQQIYLWEMRWKGASSKRPAIFVFKPTLVMFKCPTISFAFQHIDWCLYLFFKISFWFFNTNFFWCKIFDQWLFMISTSDQTCHCNHLWRWWSQFMPWWSLKPLSYALPVHQPSNLARRRRLQGPATMMTGMSWNLRNFWYKNMDQK